MELSVDTLLRLVAAVICGGLIGLNRDYYGKPTGIRAHALVALGAAILVVAGVIFDHYEVSFRNLTTHILARDLTEPEVRA